MPVHVFHEVIGAHKPSFTLIAHKLFLSSMSSLMSGQFITSGEHLFAFWERTREWFLTGVDSKMGFEMRHFEVGLVAIRVCTGELFFPVVAVVLLTEIGRL